jgi:cytochrome P450
MFILKDPIASSSVIKSERFETYSMAARYRELGQRTGINFDATVQLMDFLPVFIDGERHRDIRRSMARRVAYSKSLQETAVSDTIRSLVEKLFVPPNDVELSSQLAQPLWRAISASIVERSDDMLELVDEIPSLFYPTLSIRDRVKINGKLASFLDADRANQAERLTNLGLAVLGARPFVGSVALSVYDVVARNAGRNSNDITWPEIFPASSLCFVDRICKDNIRIDNWQFDAGSRIRCYTQDATYLPEQNTASLFGFGRHTCLGKGISEFVWSRLVERLAQIDAILVPLNLQLAEHTEPFSIPAIACIGLRPGSVT